LGHASLPILYEVHITHVNGIPIAELPPASHRQLSEHRKLDVDTRRMLSSSSISSSSGTIYITNITFAVESESMHR
jgi:hypothetical protein